MSVSRMPSDQQADATTGKPQPDVQSSQHSSSFPLTLDCTLAHLPHCSPAAAFIPLHCPPPPPPQPPSYAQSLAKSHFCHSDTQSEPPAYTSAPVITQPPKAIQTATTTNTVTSGQSGQALKRIQSFAPSTFSSGATASIPAIARIYSQKLPRPTSAGQGNPSTPFSKQIPSHILVLLFPFLLYLEIRRSSSSKFMSAQAQSNQQAFISALQKLADKQVARRCSSSSHINLLTQHVGLLCLESTDPTASTT